MYLFVDKLVSTCLKSLVIHTGSYDNPCGAVKPMGFCRRQVHIGFAAPHGTKCRVSNSVAIVMCVCVRVIVRVCAFIACEGHRMFVTSFVCGCKGTRSVTSPPPSRHNIAD